MASKKQRKQKIRERRQRQQLARRGREEARKGPSWAGLKPWHSGKLHFYEAPSIAPESLTQQERIAVVERVAQEAEDLFQREYPQN